MKPLIIANWKANPSTSKEATELFGAVENGMKDVKNVQAVICPPFIFLPVLCNKCSDVLKMGAQDCFWEEGGAYTGEISAAMLKDLCAEYVILGHSERRALLKEQNTMVNKKIKLVLGAGLKAILCVGGKSKNFKEIMIQLKIGLKGLAKKDLNYQNLVIAYEPIYAISSVGGKVLSPEEVMVGVLTIRKFLNQILGKEESSKIKILYGGSVNSQNAGDFIKKSQVSGLLVGKASLNPEEFVKIIKIAAEA